MRKMQGAICQCVFNTFWFGGKIFYYSSSCQANCCVPAVPMEGAACHLGVGTEAEGNYSFFKSHITSFKIAQVFSGYLQAVLWPWWHYSGFTPVSVDKSSHASLFCCSQPKGLERHWGWTPRLLQHSLCIPVVGEAWSPLSHCLGKKSWSFGHCIQCQVSGCILQEFWYNFNQVKCLRTF